MLAGNGRRSHPHFFEKRDVCPARGGGIGNRHLLCVVAIAKGMKNKG